MKTSHHWQNLLFIAFGLALSLPAGAAVLKQVLSGATSMTSATMTVTLGSTVDSTKSFVVCQSRTGNGANSSNPTERATCELGTGTYPVANPTNQLTITAGAIDSGATKATVQWYVAEFYSGVTVQRNRCDFASGSSGSGCSAILTINAVNLAETFPLFTENMNSVTETIDEEWTWRAQFTDSTHLAFDRNRTGTASSVAWQVIQIESSAVQAVSAGPSAGSLTGTGSLSPAVDVTRTFVVFGKKGAAAVNGVESQYQARCELTNATTVTCTRTVTGTAVTITAFAVRMTDGTTVQRGTTTINAGSTSPADPVISAVVLARSVVFISVSGGSGANSSDLDDTSVTASFTDTTHLHLQRTTSTTAATVAWFVVQFSDVLGPGLIDKREVYP